MRLIKLLNASLILPIFLELGCSSPPPTENIEKVEVPVTEVRVENVTTDLLFVADINALQNVEIKARAEGYLKEILVDEGKAVTKGQLLFKIYDEEYQAALYRADANLKSAQAELKSAEVEQERIRLLVGKEIIAKTEMDLAVAKVDIAKANIEQAKAERVAAVVKLENTNIRSPFSGMVDRIPYRLGSLITAGTLLTTISDVSDVYAYFKISEIEYLFYLRTHPISPDSLEAGSVDLILADGTPYPIKGRIETMVSEFEEGTGTLAIRARFKNPKHILKHGSNGKIKVRRQIDSVMVIPQKSTMEIQDLNYVFVVDEHNMVQMQSFKILQRYKDYYLVKSGLKPGQRIVYEGVQNISEGSVVKTRETDHNKVYNLNN